MRSRMIFAGRRIKWVIPFLFLMACVDSIDFDISQSASHLVIEGMISDAPGPYAVKVSRTQNLDNDSVTTIPVRGLKIKLYDDEGNSENLTETDTGVYMTNGVIRGKIGHAYHIELQTPDGSKYQSEPDTIRPVGEVKEIRFEYEARSIKKEYATLDANVFKIYFDSDADTGTGNYVRWRYTGTYEVLTYPERYWYWAEGFPLIDPFPCSGYVVEPSAPGGGGTLVQKAECTCCTCWANKYEDKPLLSDGELVNNGQYKNIKAAEVPVNSATFHKKFMVTIEQMSISRKVYEFFKLIRSQKEGATSLFQPPSGEITGNISAINSSEVVVGLFYAAAISSKVKFIEKSDVPYILTPIDEVLLPCTTYPNSSTTRPKYWQ